MKNNKGIAIAAESAIRGFKIMDEAFGKSEKLTNDEFTEIYNITYTLCTYFKFIHKAKSAKPRPVISEEFRPRGLATYAALSRIVQQLCKAYNGKEPRLNNVLYSLNEILYCAEHGTLNSDVLREQEMRIEKLLTQREKEPKAKITSLVVTTDYDMDDSNCDGFNECFVCGGCITCDDCDGRCTE